MQFRTLTFVAVVLLIGGAATTTLLADESELTTKRFDVSTIVVPRPHHRAPLLGGRLPTEVFLSEAPDMPEARGFLGGDDLVELIQRSVEPDSWESMDGASIHWAGRWLLVRTHPRIVSQVEQLLYKLSAEASRRVLLSVELREAASAGPPQGSDGGAIRATGTLEMPFNVRRVLKETSRVRFVSEYEVEIAQGSVISNPIVEVPDQGFVVEAIARPLLDGTSVLLEVQVQHAQYEDEVRTLTLATDEEYLPEPFRSEERSHNGVLELPAYDHFQAHVTAVVPKGGVLVVPVAYDGRLHEVRLTPTLLGEPAMPGLVDVAALTARPWGLRYGYTSNDHPYPLMVAPRILEMAEVADDDLPPLMPLEELVEQLTWLVDPWYWEEHDSPQLPGEDRILLLATDPVIARARAFLQARSVEALHTISVDLRAYSVTGAVPAGAGAELSPDAVLIRAGKIHTLGGRAASVMVGNTANYLFDYDVEVAQEARIADPIVGQGFDGLVANVVPHLSMDATTLSIDLQLLIAGRTIAAVPFAPGTQTLGPIDKVDVDRAVVDTTITTDANGTYVVDLGVDPDNPERRLVLQIVTTVR